MFCPKCKCEYRYGFITCPDCHIELEIQLTEESEEKITAIDPIKVKSVENEIDAELMMSLLRSNNIQCFKKSKATGDYMNIYMGYSVFGEDIYVDKKDYEIAIALLNDLSMKSHQQVSKVDYQIPFYKNPRIIARIILIAPIGAMLLLLYLAIA